MSLVIDEPCGLMNKEKMPNELKSELLNLLGTKTKVLLTKRWLKTLI